MISAVLFLLAQAAAATPAAPPPQSGPVTLTLRISGSRTQFKLGEIIPIELEFKSSIPKRFVVEGATMNLPGGADEFRAEPADGVTDPTADYYAANGLTG